MSAPPKLAPESAGPSARVLDTPSREELLRRFAARARLSYAMLGVEVLGILLLGWRLRDEPPRFGTAETLAVVLIGGLGLFHPFLYILLQRRKRLDALRPGARFGCHTRESLVGLARRVFKGLGLRENAAPIYVVREKEINAIALRAELLPGVGSLNWVFLNRATLHLFDEPELATIIAHELGHVFPYCPPLRRHYLVHAILGALASLWLGAVFEGFGLSPLFGAFLALGAMYWIIHAPFRDMSRAVEFLCDDHGARAGGWEAAMSGEFKLQMESETRAALQALMFEARLKGAPTPLNRLVELYDRALPFGKIDPEAVRKELAGLMQEQAETDRAPSVRGFLDYVKTDRRSENEFLEDAVKLHRAVKTLPLVGVCRTDYLGGSESWNFPMSAALCQAVETQPGALLFHDPLEISDAASTHPNGSRRLLYIWRNRAAYPSTRDLRPLPV